MYYIHFSITYKEILMKLRTYLAEHQITVKVFSEMIGYNAVYISQVGSGSKKPGKRLIQKICEATGHKVKPSDFRQENKKPIEETINLI
jgi:hypothetical protein